MSEPISVVDIDLSPIAGKTYFSIDREWREEFIYFLMVDRFQDDAVRPIVAGSDRSPGIATPNTFYGGNIKGITKNLDYIAGLGCTAIWLSPVFENNADAYHGYDISNLYVLDASSFVSSGCQNPTLTIMALAVRGCDHLMEEMKRGNV